jgi:hypothetical protein
MLPGYLYAEASRTDMGGWRAVRCLIKVQKNQRRGNNNQYNPEGQLEEWKQDRERSAWNLHPDSLAQYLV